MAGGGTVGGNRRCFQERLRLLPFCTPTMCITLIWSRQGGHRVEDTTFLHPGCVSSLWIGRYNVDGSTRNPVRKPVEGQVVLHIIKKRFCTFQLDFWIINSMKDFGVLHLGIAVPAMAFAVCCFQLNEADFVIPQNCVRSITKKWNPSRSFKDHPKSISILDQQAPHILLSTISMAAFGPRRMWVQSMRWKVHYATHRLYHLTFLRVYKIMIIMICAWA